LKRRTEVASNEYTIFVPPVDIPAFERGEEVSQRVYYAWALELGQIVQWRYDQSPLCGPAVVVFQSGSVPGYENIHGFKKVT